MTAPEQGRLTCKELIELVTDYLEGRMPEAERLKFEDHLSWCPPCVIYLEQIRMTVRAAGTLAAQDMPVADQDALLAAFRHWKTHKEG
jgi:anti-sigma factor RsiW